MRDLVRLTGLPRETIHFYLTQGLLPRPVKTGRNTAVYGAEHLERLQCIKDLQERHFLPLRAIKAVLEDGASEGFTQEQEEVLRRVRSLLPASTLPSTSGEVLVSTLVPTRVSQEDFNAMKQLGFLAVRGRGAQASVSADDAQLLELWAEVGTLLGPDEPVLTPETLRHYDDAMGALVEREARAYTQLFAQIPGERAAELIQAADPLVGRLLGTLRRKKIAALFEAIPPAPSR